ncbi:MAG: pseudouridine synthase [Candidatus Dormibacteria bacterium]
MAAERLGRWLARSGAVSRREAERLIASGRVQVGGARPPKGGRLFDPELEEVRLDGRVVRPQVAAGHRYLALNKPPGVVSTVRDPGGRPTVLDLVPDSNRLYPVGRLDLDSRGLVLLTDDGDLALRLTHPRYGVPKSYRLTLRGRLQPGQMEALRQGPLLVDGATTPLEVRVLRAGARRTVLLVLLAQGRRRQIRRMCQAVGAHVDDLERVAIGSLRLGSLGVGLTRELSPRQVLRLRHEAGLA